MGSQKRSSRSVGKERPAMAGHTRRMCVLAFIVLFSAVAESTEVTALDDVHPEEVALIEEDAQGVEEEAMKAAMQADSVADHSHRYSQVAPPQSPSPPSRILLLPPPPPPPPPPPLLRRRPKPKRPNAKTKSNNKNQPHPPPPLLRPRRNVPLQRGGYVLPPHHHQLPMLLRRRERCRSRENISRWCMLFSRNTMLMGMVSSQERNSSRLCNVLRAVIMSDDKSYGDATPRHDRCAPPLVSALRSMRSRCMTLPRGRSNTTSTMESI